MNQRLRIVMPIHSFEPGGVERTALNLAAAWQEAGAEVKVVLGRDEGAMREGAPQLDYVLEPEPIPTAAFETIWMMWRLWRYLRRNPADVVFCSGNTYSVVLVVMKLLLGRRCPPVAIKISNDLERRDLPWPARKAYHLWLWVQGRMLDHFVGMASPMRREIGDLVHLPDSRIAIIEDPSLEEGQYQALCAIARTGPSKTAPHYLAIGRLARQKNFPLLIEAFAQCGLPDARLTILGEGGDRARIERAVARHGLAARVALPGHSPDTRRYLAEADVLVMSSDYEGVPAVTLEGLAAGLPVASTDCSVSMRGLLGDGQFGKLAPVGDASALAGVMRAVLEMPFDAAAARLAAGAFRLSRAAPAYLALFQSLAKPANGPAG